MKYTIIAILFAVAVIFTFGVKSKADTIIPTGLHLVGSTDEGWGHTDKDDAEAVRREYTNPKTGEEGIAYERAYKALYGVISDVSFHDNSLKDGTVLRSLHIGLGEDENGVSQIISIPDRQYESLSTPNPLRDTRHTDTV